MKEKTDNKEKKQYSQRKTGENRAVKALPNDRAKQTGKTGTPRGCKKQNVLAEVTSGFAPKLTDTKHYTNNPKQRKKPQSAVKASFDDHYRPHGKLKVMFLGGVGEIGKNMTVFEYGNSIVILDAGMTFPNADMPGVDVVIPDMGYLVENRSKIKGLLLTHGHEDHIGALPYLVAKLGGKVDIYGTKLTLALVENKLLEHSVLDKVNMVAVSSKSIVSLGDFSAEFIHVSHSVAGSVAICLRTIIRR